MENRAPASIPDSLKELLSLWRYRAPIRGDFPRIEEVFPAASWQYILCGMGWRSAPGSTALTHGDMADGYFREAAELARRMLPALPSNRELIAHIRTRGLPRI